ncbi:auxin efflux carrier component 1-like [Vigna radiata var. radiata]|uniref:Auxin efflux carrier component n=1 Tax=Vigna radiata var. radiata TaxID=3916 RepID=A0A1S3TZ15_VIGRR|nr:auxin efflux carrier component 1-like [Vigna radiata var. radiata]
MINGQGIYNTFSAIVPLYVPMILAYGSVQWWKIITPEQCSGINRFVAFFASPFLNFYFLATNNPYTMNLRFITADTLQKLVILGALFLCSVFTKFGSIDWTITLFSLTTLPNTVVIGVPLLTAMYGDSSAVLMSHIFIMQGVVWFTLMLFLYEYRGARSLISMQFPDNGGSIVSFTIDSDVLSLGDNEPLHTEAKMRENGEIHVAVKSPSFNKSGNWSTSNRRGTQILSMQRSLSFNTIRDLRDQCFERGIFEIDEKLWKDTIHNQVKHESIVMKNDIEAIKNKKVEIENPKEVKIEEGGVYNKKQEMPRTSVMTRLILTMVWRNLIRNPNTYACALGFIWSLISFRWNIKIPLIVDGSILILSKTGTGMAMFSIGLYMALQPKLVACGNTWAIVSMVARFVVGPAVMAVAAIAIGIRGVLLRIAIIQAVLPQSIITFIFSKQYNLHTDIISTAVIFGTMISLPISLLYFVILGID